MNEHDECIGVESTLPKELIDWLTEQRLAMQPDAGISYAVEADDLNEHLQQIEI